MGFENLNVNEAPMFQAKYEEFREWLDGSLEAVTSAEINEAQKLIDGYLQNSMESTTETPEKVEALDDLKIALGELARMKAFSKRDEMLEKFAKTKLAILSQAESIVGFIPNEKVRTALYHMHQSANYLAQWKFGDEYVAQIDNSNDAKKDELEKRKEELRKINVS